MGANSHDAEIPAVCTGFTILKEEVDAASWPTRPNSAVPEIAIPSLFFTKPVEEDI